VEEGFGVTIFQRAAPVEHITEVGGENCLIEAPIPDVPMGNCYLPPGFHIPTTSFLLEVNFCFTGAMTALAIL
jgi:hypothetical protein